MYHYDAINANLSSILRSLSIAYLAAKIFFSQTFLFYIYTYTYLVFASSVRGVGSSRIHRLLPVDRESVDENWGTPRLREEPLVAFPPGRGEKYVLTRRSRSPWLPSFVDETFDPERGGGEPRENVPSSRARGSGKYNVASAAREVSGAGGVRRRARPEIVAEPRARARAQVYFAPVYRDNAAAPLLSLVPVALGRDALSRNETSERATSRTVVVIVGGSRARDAFRHRSLLRVVRTRDRGRYVDAKNIYIFRIYVRENNYILSRARRITNKT